MVHIELRVDRQTRYMPPWTVQSTVCSMGPMKIPVELYLGCSLSPADSPVPPACDSENKSLDWGGIRFEPGFGKKNWMQYRVPPPIIRPHLFPNIITSCFPISCFFFPSLSLIRVGSLPTVFSLLGATFPPQYLFFIPKWRPS